MQAMWPDLSDAIFSNMPELLGTLNVVALIFCTLLLLKGKMIPEHPEDRHPTRPLLYEFYTGLELHPRILGMDVKQLTNCRIGLMAWQLFILAFYIAGVQRHGFSAATLVNLLLQVRAKYHRNN
jgi:7-dehydrocholesterol reductase